MRYLFGILFMTSVLFQASAAEAQTGLVERGQAVYEDQKCRLCHAVAGKGNKKGPLDDVGARLTAEELKAWIVSAKEMAAKTDSTRKPAMKDYVTLSDDDVDALVAYLLTLTGA